MKLSPTILVTGGAGFIGSHIVEYFLKSDTQVRVLDNFSTGKWENLTCLPRQSQLELIEGDIGDFDIVLAATKGVKYIFHEAALISVPLSIQQPKKSFHCNTVGTFNVFEAARCCSVSRVIFASSAAVYGINDTIPLKEEIPSIPMSPYALEKHYAEELASLYYQVYGLSSVGLRYFNVYGPRQDSKSPYSGVISVFADFLSNGKIPSIHGDGEQTRDFIYVKDVVNANICSMEAIEGNYVFNVGSEQSISINQLCNLLQHLLKTSIKPKYLPLRAGDIRHSCADITCIREKIGWQYEWEIKAGLEEYIENTLVQNKSRENQSW